MLLPSPTEATQWYVRDNGDDTACDGQTNSDVSQGAPHCAFKTVNRVFDPLLPAPFAAGDDIQIGMGTFPAFSIPEIQATEANPTVITGEPSLNRNLIVINGTGSNEAILAFNDMPDDPTEWVTIKHLSFVAGKAYGINFDGRHRDILITDVETSSTQYASNFCCANEGRLGEDPNFDVNDPSFTSDPYLPAYNPNVDTNLRDNTSRAAAVRFWGNYLKARIRVENSRFVGPSTAPSGNTDRDSTYCFDGVCGINANTTLVAGIDTVVRDVESRHFMGSLLQQAQAGSLVENNLFTDSVCAGGDGCIYVYNEDLIVRRNVLDRVRTGGIFTGIRARQSDVGTSLNTTIIAYNNTLIGVTGTGLSPEVGMQWPTAYTDPNDIAANASVQTLSGVFLNNLVMELGKDASGSSNDWYAVEVKHCPTTLQLHHNAFWNNDGGLNLYNPASCSGSSSANDITTVNPLLDAAYHPGYNVDLCTQAYTAYTAPDGDTPSAYYGAKSCRSSGGGEGGGCTGLCYQE